MAEKKKKTDIVLFLVGKWDGENTIWEFQGIFDTKKEAENECKTIKYFVAPVVVNQKLSHKLEDWPELYFPKHKDK